MHYALQSTHVLAGLTYQWNPGREFILGKFEILEKIWLWRLWNGNPALFVDQCTIPIRNQPNNEIDGAKGAQPQHSRSSG